MNTTTTGRRNGSAKFAPYFKVQCFDPRSCCWRDIQRSYASVREARAAFPSGKQCRIMAVTETGRAPLPESDVSG